MVMVFLSRIVVCTVIGDHRTNGGSVIGLLARAGARFRKTVRCCFWEEGLGRRQGKGLLQPDLKRERSHPRGGGP